MMMEEDSESLLVTSSLPVPRPTPYRWVILALFSLFSLLQSAVWDTWGPISPSATYIIGFTPHDYDLLSNWAPIGIMTAMPIFIWLMNKKGARIPVVAGSVLVAAGTGLRCLPLSGVALKYCIHIGQLLNAFAGCSVLGAVTLLSNTWFPPSERIFATSCMVLLGNIGNALSFLVGPAIVDSPNNCSITTSTPKILVTATEASTQSLLTTICFDNTEQMRKQINYYLYGEFAFAAIVCLFTIVLFQNKPMVPPSASAAVQRLEILAGLRDLSKKYSYWAMVISFALVNGAYYGWYGIVTVLLTPNGVSATEVGNAAFVMTTVGTVLGIAVGWFADRVKGHTKWILFACYCAMFIVFLYLVMMIMDWVHAKAFEFTDSGFWATFIIIGSISSIIQPLGMEMAADIAYPVSEGTSSSIVAWFIMLFMFIFLLILNSVSNQDIANYLFLTFVGVAAPVLAVSTRNQNVRLDVDRSIQEERRAAVQEGDFQGNFKVDT